MPKDSPKKSSLLQFLLTFAIVYLLVTTGMRMLFPDRYQRNGAEPPPFTLQTEFKKLVMGGDMRIQIKNTTEDTIIFPAHCPTPPVAIEQQSEGEFFPLDLSGPVLPCTQASEIPGNTSLSYDLSPWKYVAFQESGTYRLSLLPETTVVPVSGTGAGSAMALSEYLGTRESVEASLTVKKPGAFTALFRALISKPLFNALVFIASLLPRHSLGWSIVIVTVIVKLLLFLPSQHAIESQRKLQALQPKIDAIKKKYVNDHQKVTQETMQLWKEEKINPFQSCLPTLLQIPVLLGLFFVTRGVEHVALLQHLLYPVFLHIDWSFATNFLGILELTRAPMEGITRSLSIETFRIALYGLPLPLAIGGLQFFQMHMIMKKQKTKKAPQTVVEAGSKKPFLDRLAESLNPQTMMLTMLPVMIVFIAGTLPASVSLYWGTSTLFAIGQQLVMERRKE